jgi:hypothetical protein
MDNEQLKLNENYNDLSMELNQLDKSLSQTIEEE